MVPHKTARGAAALKRLELYEGVPPAQDKLKKVVVPQALRVLRLKPGRKYCTLKRISHEFGWAHKDVIDRLEEKRKAKGKAYFERKVSATLSSMRIRKLEAIDTPKRPWAAALIVIAASRPQAPRKGIRLGPQKRDPHLVRLLGCIRISYEGHA